MHNKQKEKQKLQKAVDKIAAEIEQAISDVREKKDNAQYNKILCCDCLRVLRLLALTTAPTRQTTIEQAETVCNIVNEFSH